MSPPLPPGLVLVCLLLSQTPVGQGQAAVCYRQALPSRQLANRYIRLSKTAYSLTDCQDLCTREPSFSCLGFAYRQPQSAGEVLNCDLTDKDTKTLDPYSSYDFYQSTTTDFYERSGEGADCRQGAAVETGGEKSECYTSHLTRHKHYTYRDYRTSGSASVCGQECRLLPWCQSFSFRESSTSSDIGNCLLSDTATSALRDPEDIVQDTSWDLYGLSLSSSCSSSSTAAPATQECAEVARAGYRHYSTGQEEQGTIYELEDCAQRCRARTTCNTFSYRQGGRAGCSLSPLRAAELLPRDLTQDRDWSVYRPIFGGACTASGGGGGGGGGGPYYPVRPSTPYDCFRIYEANYRLDSASARRSILTRDLRECEESCEQEPQFTCTTLSFSSGQSSTNCHLADTPPTALTLGRDLVRDYGSDVYEKRSTAACRSGGGGDGGYTPGFNGHDYTKCSNFELPGQRLSYSASREVTGARDAADCEEQCLQQNRFSCRSFAFRYSGSSGANCEMSDREARDLEQGQDTTRDRDWDLFSRTRYSGECRGAAGSGGQDWQTSAVISDRLGCYARYRSDTTFRGRAVVETVEVRDAEECARQCDFFRERRQYQCHAMAYREDSARNGGTCILSDSYGRDIDADLEYSRDWEVWEFRGEGRNCRSDSGSTEVAGEYTVNGARCLRGGCRLNPDVKYWYCETEDDRGWDYCCRPEHRCGYSDGFSYPWCFVGEAGYDQWRPCDAERARTGDRLSGYLASGRPRYSYLHSALPPTSRTRPVKQPPPSRVDYSAKHQKLFNGEEIPFTSLSGGGTARKRRGQNKPVARQNNLEGGNLLDKEDSKREQDIDKSHSEVVERPKKDGVEQPSGQLSAAVEVNPRELPRWW